MAGGVSELPFLRFCYASFAASARPMTGSSWDVDRAYLACSRGWARASHGRLSMIWMLVAAVAVLAGNRTQFPGLGEHGAALRGPGPR